MAGKDSSLPIYLSVLALLENESIVWLKSCLCGLFDLISELGISADHSRIRKAMLFCFKKLLVQPSPSSPSSFVTLLVAYTKAIEHICLEEARVAAELAAKPASPADKQAAATAETKPEPVVNDESAADAAEAAEVAKLLEDDELGTRYM